MTIDELVALYGRGSELYGVVWRWRRVDCVGLVAPCSWCDINHHFKAAVSVLGWLAPYEGSSGSVVLDWVSLVNGRLD